MAQTIAVGGAAFDALKQVDAMQGSIPGLLIATDNDAIQSLADACDAAAGSARTGAAGLEKTSPGIAAIFGEFEKIDKAVIEMILRGDLGMARQAFVERSSVAADKFRSAVETGRTVATSRLDGEHGGDLRGREPDLRHHRRDQGHGRDQPGRQPDARAEPEEQRERHRDGRGVGALQDGLQKGLRSRATRPSFRR